MVALSTYLITFRLLHILGAIAWGGAIFVMVFFIQPTAKAIGPTAGPFMRELLSRRKIVTVVLWIALTTIVSGGFLYWHDWRAFGSYGRFIKSRYGLALTLGAISALAAFLIGLFGTKPTIDRTFALGAQIASVGDQPPPALVGQLQAMQERGRTLAKLNLTFVALAALFTATARYW